MHAHFNETLKAPNREVCVEYCWRYLSLIFLPIFLKDNFPTLGLWGRKGYGRLLYPRRDANRNWCFWLSVALNPLFRLPINHLYCQCGSAIFHYKIWLWVFCFIFLSLQCLFACMSITYLLNIRWSILFFWILFKIYFPPLQTTTNA